MYVIAGATGNTGKPLAMSLLKAGKPVRIISRDEQKAQELVRLGAEWVNGSSTDKGTLEHALEGATAAYVLVPPNLHAADFPAYQAEASENIAQALQASGVRYAVTLSSVGAHLTSGAGVVQGLHHMENRINQVPNLNVLHLRPTYFLENTLGQVGAIKMMGSMAGPVVGDLKLPMIATQDIGAYAAKRLLALDFTGHQVQDLLGAQEVSYHELAGIYGARIGVPDLQYVQVPYEAFRDVMVQQWGASESMADKMVEFTQALNAGRIAEILRRDAASTTPTTVAQFADVFAHVYHQ